MTRMSPSRRRSRVLRLEGGAVEFMAILLWRPVKMTRPKMDGVFRSMHPRSST